MPAYTKTSLANLALTKLGPGGGFLTDFDTDTSTQAQACRRTYESVREKVLESHPWRFARKRAELTYDIAGPSWGFTYQYTPPNDFLRILSVQGKRIVYEVENGKILTDDAGPLNIRYIASITDTGMFSPTFAAALASRWAAELAMTITQSSEQRQSLLEEYLLELRNARRTDNIGNVPEQAVDGLWLDSRL